MDHQPSATAHLVCCSRGESEGRQTVGNEARMGGACAMALVFAIGLALMAACLVGGTLFARAVGW